MIMVETPSPFYFPAILVEKAYLFPTISSKIPGLRLLALIGLNWFMWLGQLDFFPLFGPAWLTCFFLELDKESSPPRPKLTAMETDSPPKENEEVSPEEGGWMPAKQEQVSITKHSSFIVLPGALPLT